MPLTVKLVAFDFQGAQGPADIAIPGLLHTDTVCAVTPAAGGNYPLPDQQFAVEATDGLLRQTTSANLTGINYHLVVFRFIQV